MKIDLVIHILRNPFKYSDDVVKEARLFAADKLEGLQKLIKQFGKED